ncbi:hypothetical protein HYW67_04440 [Candidatus Parcubacteria bacterium]|nr:hypothetical protein [Candidatus Parcubacteria bacterium]
MGTTEWVLVTLLTPETHGAWIADLRQFLVDRGTVFVPLGTTLVMRRMDFTVACRESRKVRQSETLYRVRPFNSEVMDALSGGLPVDLLPQFIGEVAVALRRTQ